MQHADIPATLLTAAKNGNWTLVKLLVEGGADLQAKDKTGQMWSPSATSTKWNTEGWTVLHFAAISGHLDTVRWLVEKGADLQAKTNDGWTVLHWAAINGHLDTVKWLVERGADLQAKDKYGCTVLHYAARNGQLDTVKWLVEEKGGDVNARSAGWMDVYNGWTVLLWAASNGHLDTVKYLVEKGADVNAKTDNGNTALFLIKHNEVKQWLRQHGAT